VKKSQKCVRKKCERRDATAGVGLSRTNREKKSEMKGEKRRERAQTARAQREREKDDHDAEKVGDGGNEGEKGSHSFRWCGLLLLVFTST
jgi:hypothetical protein